MRTSRSHLALGCVLLAAACSREARKAEEEPTLPASAPGYWHTEPSGSFSVKFPGKPTEQREKAATALGPIEVVALTYKTGRVSYIASGTPLPLDASAPIDEKGFLRSAVDGALKTLDGIISEESSIAHDGCGGAEVNFTGRHGSETIRGVFRLFLDPASRTLYQALVITEGSSLPGDARDFLASFKVRCARTTVPAAAYLYTPADKSYSATFPGAPVENKQTLETAFGSTEMTLAIYETPDGGYMSSVMPLPLPLGMEHDAKKALDGARDGVIARGSVTLLSESDISRDGQRGREILLTRDKGGQTSYGVQWIFWGQETKLLYQALVFSRSSELSPEGRSFLESFAIKQPANTP